jgi:predicted nucleic acid-binding protein
VTLRTKVIAANVFVVDASTAAKWFLADEASADADAVLTRIGGGEYAIAPDIFRLEIQNLLLSAERAGRIAGSDVDDALEELRNLPIEINPSTNRFIPGAELGLARAYSIQRMMPLTSPVLMILA